jgi:hypothetical protein
MTSEMHPGEASKADDLSPLAREAFDLICRKCVQRADERQKAMGLQYTTVETHDLARMMAVFAEARIATLEGALRLAIDIFSDMFRAGLLYTPSGDEPTPHGSYYIGPDVMRTLSATLSPEREG